jgi:hypothetical protein
LRKILKQQDDILKISETISQVSRRHKKFEQVLIKHMPELGLDLVSDEEEANFSRPSAVLQYISTLDNVYDQADFDNSQHSSDGLLSANKEEETGRQLLADTSSASPVGPTPLNSAYPSQNIDFCYNHYPKEHDSGFYISSDQWPGMEREWSMANAGSDILQIRFSYPLRPNGVSSIV